MLNIIRLKVIKLTFPFTSVSAVTQINPGIPVLCGAGVKDQADVSKALSLGSQGILLASGVVKSSEPRKVLIDLIQGL